MPRASRDGNPNAAAENHNPPTRRNGSQIGEDAVLIAHNFQCAGSSFFPLAGLFPRVTRMTDLFDGVHAHLMAVDSHVEGPRRFYLG